MFCRRQCSSMPRSGAAVAVEKLNRSTDGKVAVFARRNTVECRSEGYLSGLRANGPNMLTTVIGRFCPTSVILHTIYHNPSHITTMNNTFMHFGVISSAASRPKTGWWRRAASAHKGVVHTDNCVCAVIYSADVERLSFYGFVKFERKPA